jgi:hypothetical protein
MGVVIDSPMRVHLPLLDHSQEGDLQFKGHLPDFTSRKMVPAVGEFEFPRASPLFGSRERPIGVAEKLAGDQFAGDGAALMAM